ncbi:hypothetical protein J3Q64DRAFT_1842543 [Phycomyces blakesleeanus]|uniref:Leucine-rich repeat-containing N-terminal plant-type domain-containing protein n=1 Tax=Phycomyces blakesleeanus TaxID=4837 RepID=A0ABR3AHY0_PHYBL
MNPRLLFLLLLGILVSIAYAQDEPEESLGEDQDYDSTEDDSSLIPPVSEEEAQPNDNSSSDGIDFVDPALSPETSPSDPGLSTVIPLNSIVSEATCSALSQWYKELGGTNWKTKTGWESTNMTSCCSWYNVHCSKFGQVDKINLSRNNLLGQLPDNLNNFPELIHLDMSHNEITGSIPSSINSAIKLQTIKFDYNKLSGDLPPVLGSLPSLTNVHLKNNSFTGTVPAAWGSIPTLKGLFLSNNKLKGGFPVAIQTMPSLEVLKQSSTFDNTVRNLKGNRLLGSIPESMGSITSLTSLVLSHQMLNGSIPESLYGLSNLVSLDLSRNRLTGNLSEKISGLVKLQKLTMSHNGLSGPIPPQLGSLQKLQLLTLNYNMFNGQFPPAEAPKPLGYCYMVPNQFQVCSDTNSITDVNSLAFQCAVDCASTRRANSTQTSKASGQLDIYGLVTLIAIALGLISVTLL